MENTFLPRVDITGYNVLIDGRNFYGQPISDQIKKYDEIRKIATEFGDDYTTACLKIAIFQRSLPINCS